MSRPITRDGNAEVTSWTNSTSPFDAASAMISRQMARICGSIDAMTRALKRGATGRR